MNFDRNTGYIIGDDTTLQSQRDAMATLSSNDEHQIYWRLTQELPGGKALYNVARSWHERQQAVRDVVEDVQVLLLIVADDGADAGGHHRQAQVPCGSACSFPAAAACWRRRSGTRSPAPSRSCSAAAAVTGSTCRGRCPMSVSCVASSGMADSRLAGR